MTHGTVPLTYSIYAIGGFFSVSVYTKLKEKCYNLICLLYRFDINTNKWSEVTLLSTGRYCHCAAVLSGKFYVFGGRNGGEGLNSVECHNPESNISM